VLGGGSSINDQIANRGASGDYEWEFSDADGWGWKDVLPFFRKVERDLDFTGPLHGHKGGIPIRRIMPEHWDGHVKAAAQGF
jgi:5-(hydroxymethyl)furfural/furfural oxidase